MLHSKNCLFIGKMILNLRKAVEKLGTISHANHSILQRLEFIHSMNS